MINKRINVCYVIEVNYWHQSDEKEELRTQKFLSQHQFGSKRFNAFMNDYFSKISGFRRFFNDDLGSQRTIRRADWNEMKEEVLANVTEKEKCY